MIKLKCDDEYIYVYIDGFCATKFENSTIESVIEWINKNIKCDRISVM